MRQFKLVISLLLFAMDRFVAGLRRLVGLKCPPRCVVLCYHSVLDSQREGFARQMDVVLRYARPLHADVRTKLEEGGRYAVITFDDANLNILDNALPALRSRNIPSTIFAISHGFDKIPDWPAFGRDYTADDRIMKAEQLAALASPLIKIGSHTMTHPVLTTVDESQAKQELVNSRLNLEKMLGRPVRTFAFPYGAYNEKLVQWCKEAGYERIFTTDPVYALTQPDEFVSGRMMAEPTDGVLEFRLKLAGAYRWVKSLSSLKQWIRRTLSGAGA